MTFTKRHLFDLAVAQVDFKGSPDDWQGAQKALLDAKDENGEPCPIEEVKVGTEVIKIRELVFQKSEKPRGRRINFVTDPEAEGADDKFQTTVQDEVQKQLAAQKRNGRITQQTDATVVGDVESGEERMYKARISQGVAAFKSYGMAFGFAAHLQHQFLVSQNRTQEAQALYTAKAQELENRGMKLTTKGYTQTTTASGGALVPEGFDADLWQLVLGYGVARKVARQVTMTSETITRPKATGDLTVYYPAEGTAGTESTKTLSNVQMRAKGGIVIVKTSRALAMNAAISVVDDAARDIARAIAKTEDKSLFLADGSGVANGYIPGTQGVLNIISETSTGARVYNSASSTGSLGVTLSEIVALTATVGSFVGMFKAFHCTEQVGAAIFHRLAASVGGIQPMQIQGLGLVPSFLGYPIIYNNVMRSSLTDSANAQLVVFGDMSLAADFGDRTGVVIEMSEQRYWDENNIGIKGTVFHDLNVHGLGTSSDTGPIAVLLN